MPTAIENSHYLNSMSSLGIPTSLPPIVTKQNGTGDAEDRPEVKKNGFMEEAPPISSRTRNRYLNEFFSKEPSLYSHTVFRYAAGVYNALRKQEEIENPYLAKKVLGDLIQDVVPEIPIMEFESQDEQRLTYTLAFTALKYQKLLEGILEDIMFFSIYPEYKDDYALTVVMFCDLQQRKFQRRSPIDGEDLEPYLTEIEEKLFSHRTKMNASLARARVKAQATSLEYLLPEKLRIKEQAHKCDTVVYAWVNMFKTTLNMVIDILASEGFKQVQPFKTEHFEGDMFYVDSHCSDLIAFPAEHRQYIMRHDLVLDGFIIIQDKSSCLGPLSVKSLIDDGDDIVHVNLGSGQTTAHLASLVCNTESTIFAFGIQSDKHYEQVKGKMDRLGIRGVRIIQDQYVNISPEDPRFKNVKAILISADCSKSGVPDPVDFIVNEGEGATILRDLASGELDPSKLSILGSKHLQILKTSFRFHRVQGIVYCTRSMYEAENENVICRAIEQCNSLPRHQRFPFKLTPPVLPVTDRDLEKNIVVGKYLKFPPAAGMSGCFVALITRELDDPKEATKDILARAAAKGLLGNRPEKKPTRLERVRSDHHHGNEDITVRHKRKKSPKKSKSKASAVSKPARFHVNTRLFPGTPRGTQSQTRRPSVSAPHVSVVQHPAPFR